MEKYCHSTAAHLLLKCSLGAASLFLLPFHTVLQEDRKKGGCSTRAASGQARTWDIPWTQTGIWLFADSWYKNPSPDNIKPEINLPLKSFAQDSCGTHFKPQDNRQGINRGSRTLVINRKSNFYNIFMKNIWLSSVTHRGVALCSAAVRSSRS